MGAAAVAVFVGLRGCVVIYEIRISRAASGRGFSFEIDSTPSMVPADKRPSLLVREVVRDGYAVDLATAMGSIHAIMSAELCRPPPDCSTCEDTGEIPDDDLIAVACPDCKLGAAIVRPS